MLKNYFIIYIGLCTFLCGPSWAQIDSGRDEETAVVNLPLWQQLEAMSLEDKENGLIQFEVLEELDPALYRTTRQIEEHWNSGSFDAAIDGLRRLDATGEKNLSAGIHWKVPKPAASPGDMGADTPVEARGGVYSTVLDFHDGTGNLFVVTRRQDGTNPRWTVNISKDDGLSWNETYTWGGTSNEIRTISAVVIDQYLYIAYVADDASASYTAARMRRCFAATGTVDGGFSFQIVFDKGFYVDHVALTSNEDTLGSNIYFFAALQTGSLIYHFADQNASSWIEIATGVTDVSHALDAAFNEGFSTHLNMVSYISFTWRLKVVLRSGWTVKDFDDAKGDNTTITAYNDSIFVAYEFDPGAGRAIKYQISYNGGTNWAFGYVAEPQAGEEYFTPAATARRGGGISVIYSEQDSEPDPIWHRHRVHTTPYVWSTPETFNEMDVSAGWLLAHEWIPPLPGGGSHAYGSVWFPNFSTGPAVFDRTDGSFGSLMADIYSVTAQTGSTVNFSLDAGVGNGFRNYLMLGGVTGTEPGFNLPGGFVTFPVNWDPFTDLVLNYLNTALFQNFLGALTGSGKSTAALNAPALAPTFLGVNMFYAFCLNAPFDFVSNPVVIKIVP